MDDTDLQIVCELPHGHTLFREPNGVGGTRYWSDEITGGMLVWDTSLISTSTMQIAIAEELKHADFVHRTAQDIDGLISHANNNSLDIAPLSAFADAILTARTKGLSPSEAVSTVLDTELRKHIAATDGDLLKRALKTSSKDSNEIPTTSGYRYYDGKAKTYCWSSLHPVESFLCPDATQIEEMTKDDFEVWETIRE